MFREDVAVPKNPESEGGRLITLKQIELEHGVSRSALHTYRRSASFPQPIAVEGSTKIQYRADEVAAWFDANSPQQGKRTDLVAKKQQGATPMTREEYEEKRRRLEADAEDAKKSYVRAKAVYDQICTDLRNLRVDWNEQQKQEG